MIESILIDVGTAVAHQVFEAKARDRLKSGTIQDLLTKRGFSILESRKAERQFDQVAEAIAARISRQVEIEARGMPDNEVTAALMAVRDCFTQAEIDYVALLEIDLDPSALETRVLESSRSLLRSASLSEAAEFLFEQVLRECCNYVTEIAMEVPEFAGKAFREILQRETELLDVVQEVLDRMPTAEGSDAEDPDQVFELQYRRQVARKLDELQLFGLTVSEGIRRYPLTVAYISLRLDTAVATTTSEADPQEDGLIGESPEAVVGQHHRLIIRGEAGSGKTTLLQWLAVSAARETFTGNELSKSRLLPFFLQLRRYVGKKLPTPGEFLDLVTPALAEQAPPNWTARQLSAGRGLILIDGLDELPLSQRNDVAEWLDDLETTFPESRFVITSRSSGLTEAWIERVAFADAELLPMSVPDIDSFIEHWHSAALSGVADSGSRDELMRYEQKLKALVASTRPIQSLATSPLLCAMLCALHRDRRTQVPSDRLELYRIALETLLERRDVERRVSISRFELSLPQKLVLLQDISFWLLLNDQSDAPREDMIERIGLKLQSMSRVQARPAEVYEYLLERSGLIREPVVGRVDFIHRTFQEYLGAQEAVTQNNIGLLGEKATDDQWREVIVLACGLAAPRQAHALISDLLGRGNNNPVVRHVMHLMAVACLETTVQLDKDLAAQIEQALHGLVPPSSMAEAKLLASAGELAVPALRGFRRRYVGETAACVRALSMIGGDAALAALAEYGNDSRVGVFKELIRGWAQFDSERYAEVVLKRSPMLQRGFVATDVSVVRAAEHLPGTIPIRCRLPRIGPDLEPLRAASQVTALELIGNDRVRNISAISSLPNLRLVDFERCRGVTDFSPMIDCKSLRWLDVSYTSFGPDFACLPANGGLEYLRAFNVPQLQALGGIERHEKLSVLQLRGLGDIPALEWNRLEGLGSLYEVWIESESFPGLNAVRSPGIGSLRVSARMEVGAELSFFEHIRSLNLTGGIQCGPDFATAVGGLRRLRDLTLSGSLPDDLIWLPTSVRKLDLRGYPGSALTGVPAHVSTLRLAAAPNLSDVSALENLPQLRSLFILDCPSIVDFSSLASLPRGCRVLLDLDMKDLIPKELRTTLQIQYLRPRPMATLSGSANVG